MADLLSNKSEVSPTHWKMGQLNYEEWEQVGRTLMQIRDSINWWIGDWLNEGERAFGETYAQAIEITGWDISRLQSAKWVSSRVPTENRFAQLSWSHHNFVAKYDVGVQYKLLESAVTDSLSTRDFKERLKQYDKEGFLFGESVFGNRSPTSSPSCDTPETVENNHPENQCKTEHTLPKENVCPHCGKPIP